ncbi:MAG: UvrD-helicase domain-containing protein [Kiritimatiellae bacterium]|nr:UvrD-helicase domain-containing protein [Kiritimatiellia bacterium]
MDDPAQNDILAALNDEQAQAVTATEGYVRVVAGAGSGKTRALAYRFAYLVNVLGVLPAHILCVTFSNKSAAEMRQRIHSLTGDNDTGYVCTFHSFCVTVLQEDSNAVGYPKSFLVLDNSDIDAMLKVVYEERRLSLRDMTFAKARDLIEIRKTVTEKDYYRDLIALTADEIRFRYEQASAPADIVFYGYLYQQKKCFGLDYNDLVVFTLHIFETNPETALKWQKRLEYVMVDEFQDIDPLLHRLMEALCAYHRNLFVVGDPDQTIYSWRGADVRFLLDFDKKFAPAKTILMTRNYRSTPEILAAVNSLIDKNAERIKKDLVATRPAGPKPLYLKAKTSEAEADWIVARMKELHEAGLPFADMAVLYRAHFATRPIEDALVKAEIPYVLYSGIPFFDRAEIKDALSYLRLLAYRDDLSFLRVANTPKRNLGERRMAFLKQAAEENRCTLYEALVHALDADIFKGTKARELVALVEGCAASGRERPVSETLVEVLDESGYETMLRTEGAQTRLDNLAELKQSVYEYEATCGEECTLEHYLARVALFTNRDAGDAGDRVKLMTVHTAKGLEFPNVFVAALNEGVMPSRKTDSERGMEEERRIAFVALTRARDRLFLSSADGRNFDGSVRFPSRFILDIDRDRLDYVVKLGDDVAKDIRRAIEAGDRFRIKGKSAAQSAAFAVGDAVRHRVFGPGRVLAVDAAEGAYTIRFDALPTPRVLSFRTPLERA